MSYWLYRGYRLRWAGLRKGPVLVECQIIDRAGKLLARFPTAAQAETWVDKEIDG